MNKQNMENEQAQNRVEIRINTEQTQSPQFQEPKWMIILRGIMETRSKLNENGVMARNHNIAVKTG
jgi:hypothetical protein